MSHTTAKPHTTPATCSHCGDYCNTKELIEQDNLQFCCQGCQTVYNMLISHNLKGFYDLEENPGLSLKRTEKKGEYAFLDDDEFKAKLLQFSDGNIAKTSFYLPQIHCTSCLWLLERLPWLHKGIQTATVNYLKKEVYINFQPQIISLRQIAELLASLGYAPNISLEDNEAKHQKDYSFYYKLGLTGFCAGNIMLMSFPEYLGISTTDNDYQQLFGYLNLVLSLPVLFYGGIDYLKSAYQAIKHKGLNIDVPIALGMLAIWLQSSYEIITHTGAGYLDSLAALVFLLLTGKWFQQRTFDHISFERDYKSYFPIAVSQIQEDGSEKSIALDKLDKGDRIKVRHGELIPADAVLEKGDAHIDYSFITGEALPVSKSVGELIYAGGRQQGSSLELTLTKSVSQSYLTQLWTADAFQKEGRNMQTITDRIGRRFTIGVLLVAFATAIYWWPIDTATAISSFTAVLIIACPCALALNVPFALGNALRILAKRGFYIKDTSVIEQLAHINHAVFDKTGTIATAGKPHFHGHDLNSEQQAIIKTLVSQSTHPLSQQIGKTIQVAANACYEVGSFKEVAGKGIEGTVAGHIVKIGSATFLGVSNSHENFQSQVHIRIDGEYLGYFAIGQELRNGASTLVSEWKSQFPCSMLSGDHDGELYRMQQLFGDQASLLFEQSPQQKMEYIQQLQKQGATVAMLGDGLNDAGALKQSDVGIAISEEAHQFSPACDAILHAQNLPQLPKMHQFTKASLKVVYAGFALSLAYNMIGLSYATQGILSPVVAAILMPLSSITVVGFGTLMTSWLGRKLLTPKK